MSFRLSFGPVAALVAIGLHLTGIFAVAPRALEARTVASTRPFCWVVRSETATAYLLGSIHVARPDVYPLPEALEKAFARSETLVVEADARSFDLAGAGGSLLGLAMYPAGDSLEKHISKELLDKVLERAPLPPEQALRFRPWMLALTLAMSELSKLGITPANGIDLHFLNRAGDRQVIELEGVEHQLEMLAGFEEKQQVLFLEYTVRDFERLEENINEILRVWKSGDLNRSRSSYSTDGAPSPTSSPSTASSSTTETSRWRARSVSC